MPKVWLRLVRVSGNSMTPTLLNGDVVLVRSGASARTNAQRGDIALARFRSRPDLLVVKRLKEQHDGGWLVSSDNSVAGSDSRTYGLADVLGTTRWCWRRRVPLARRRGLRWIPLRLGPAPGLD